MLLSCSHFTDEKIKTMSSQVAFIHFYEFLKVNKQNKME